MTRARKLSLALLVFACLGSTGCVSPSTVGRLANLDLRRQMLDRGAVQDATRRTSEMAAGISGALLVLVALHCGIKAMRQDVTLWSVAQEYAVGAVVMTVLLASWQAGGQPAMAVVDAGLSMADQVGPDTSMVTTQLVVEGRRLARAAMDMGSGRTPLLMPAPMGALYEAIGAVLQMPSVGYALLFNLNAVFIMRLVAQGAYAFVLAIYWVLGPLAAPFVALPQTRQVFFGWLKAFICVALWPFFFALIERLIYSLPMNVLCGSTLGPGLDAVSNFQQGMVIFAVINLVAVVSYMGTPVLAYLIVGGVGKPFRGVM